MNYAAFRLHYYNVLPGHPTRVLFRRTEQLY